MRSKCSLKHVINEQIAHQDHDLRFWYSSQPWHNVSSYNQPLHKTYNPIGLFFLCSLVTSKTCNCSNCPINCKFYFLLLHPKILHLDHKNIPKSANHLQPTLSWFLTKIMQTPRSFLRPTTTVVIILNVRLLN